MLSEAFQYKLWADRRAVEAIARLDAERSAAALAFTLQQLNHMLIVEDLFRARLLGLPAPHAATNSAVVPDHAELARRLELSGQWYAEQAAQLTPATAAQVLVFHFADGQPGRMRREEVLFHVLNHATYHRGAIGHALDLAGVAHPADTYTVFVHATQPERRDG